VKIVTSWETWSEKHQAWEHNHLEDGYSELDVPVGDPGQTKAWKQKKWKKTFGYLNDENKLIVV